MPAYKAPEYAAEPFIKTTNNNNKYNKMSFAIPSPYAWDASFDVKQQLFNDDHKKLFDLINALDADRSSGAKLKALLDFVLVHFKNEEDFFAAKGWTEAVEHKKIHDKFVQDALAVKAVDDGVMQFIKNWLVVHIKGSDMKYVGL